MASTQLSKLLATVPLLVMAFSAPAFCQQSEPTPPSAEISLIDFSKARAFPCTFAPCYAPFVHAPQLDNSRRLEDLIVDGKLTLIVDDAIALALENNLQIAVTRYDLPIAQNRPAACQRRRRHSRCGGLTSIHYSVRRQPRERRGRQRKGRRHGRGRSPRGRHQRRGPIPLLRSESLCLLLVEQRYYNVGN